MLVVDDHDVVHWGFRLMLGQMPWVERCLSARTGAEALAVCRRYEPHVALVDLFLGRRVRAGDLRAPARRGAGSARAADVRGRRHLPPRGARRRRGRLHLQGLARPGDRQAGAHGRRRAGGLQGHRAPGVPTLTDREREILGLIAGGATNREIAAALYLSPHTVKEHTSTLYRKLGARNRADAVQRAQRLGLHR